MNSRLFSIANSVGLILLPLGIFAQEVNLKQQAQEAFKAANYPQAISLLRQAISEKPIDAEAYYYLGFFTHYLCYDSIPLTGYGEHNSDEALAFLRKAVALEPNLGNAYYFIGAEHGARFLRQMQAGKYKGMVAELKRAYDEGGLPDWLVEYNRNMLSSCAPDAILFTGGDAETDAAWYAQYVEGFRRDVTVIPVGALSRPWYVWALKEKTNLIPAVAPISWSQEQILSMRPYKWKANGVSIPISDAVRQEFHLGSEAQQMEWLVEPDLSADQKTYLSANLAVMVDIIKTNAWKRPVYFSFGMIPPKGLEGYLQVSGITSRLLPIKPGGGVAAVDVARTRDLLLNPDNFRFLGGVKTKDYSRVAQLPSNYRTAFLALIQYYQQTGERQELKAILKAMKASVPEQVVSIDPGLSSWLGQLEVELEK